ncbi:MAG: hypothetical protein WCS86_02310 [Candidatus Paceibacterota bacterium]
MIKYKKIDDLFESWGRDKVEVPLNNDILKKEILAKIPDDLSLNKKISFKRNSYIWFPFAFSAMAVFVILFNTFDYKNNTNVQDIIQTGYGTGISQNSDMYKSIGAPSVDLYHREELPITDNREFLKVNYNATLRTRNVIDLRNRLEIIIRGFGGRVDSSNSGEKNGYINFVIPKDRLDAFKIEIEDLVGKKFYNEQLSSQNLLGDKQRIEENQKQAEKNLGNLQAERAQIIREHNQNISSYQNEVDIINENKSYQTKINNIDLSIKSMQASLKKIQSQDKNFLDNVATVNGSISLNWISLWEMADIYLPGPILAWVFFLATIVSFIWYRFTRVSYDILDFS